VIAEELPSFYVGVAPHCAAPAVPAAPSAAAAAGVTTEEQLLSPDNAIHPDCYMDDLAGLLEVQKVAA
jgi:hypothetical protein